ncbi:MAG: AtpZ/AtpI family protein [Flavobacteriales bacterium]
MEESKDKKEPSHIRNTHPILRYSGMAFSMAAIIGLGTWLGIQLDSHFKSLRPIWTAVGSLCGTLISVYQVIQTLRT